MFSTETFSSTTVFNIIIINNSNNNTFFLEHQIRNKLHKWIKLLSKTLVLPTLNVLMVVLFIYFIYFVLAMFIWHKT